MKNLFASVFLVLCGPFLIGCSGENVFGPSWITERFSGIPDELFYQTKGLCEDGSLVFHVLSGAGAILWDVPQTQSASDILTGEFHIYLNRDGNYSAVYKEYFFDNTLNFAEQYDSQYLFDGETQVIHFSDIGTATIRAYKHRYFLQLTFVKNLNSAFLRGQTIHIWLTRSDKGLDTDRNQYCDLRS